MAIGLAVFIVFGFAQFTARGFGDPLRAPFWVHLHGAAMLAWLALLIVQPTLVSRRTLVLHRWLGWVAAALTLVIPHLAAFIGFTALLLHPHLPLTTPPFFLALTPSKPPLLPALVATAAPAPVAPSRPPPMQ